MCFQKRIFFSPFSPPCTCHSVFGCRTLKTGSRVEIYENAGFSFSCGGPKTDLRISDVIHLTAHALYVKEAIYSAIFILGFSCSWARMTWQGYVYIYASFFWRKIEKRKVSILKKIIIIPNTSGWGLSLSCETCVVTNSYGRDWSREIVKPNLWKNSAFSDQ